MIKKIEKITKMLLFVLIAFCVLFTIINIEENGIFKAIKFSLNETNIINMSEEEIKQIASNYEESITEQSQVIARDKETNYGKVYEEHPIGIYVAVKDFLEKKSYNENLILALVLGIIVGIGYFLIYDNDKKGVKSFVAYFVLFMLLLGIFGDTDSLIDNILNLLSSLLVTGMIAVIDIAKQQMIARELNKKLEEEKKRTQIDDNEREETFLERTKEKREKIGKIMQLVLGLMMILLLIIYFILA